MSSESQSPPPMSSRIEIGKDAKTYVIVVDDKGILIRELGKQPRYAASWQDVIEFAMQQQFFTFQK